MNEERGIIWTTRAALALAAIVIVSAAILGYTALADLFGAIDLFPLWLAYLFPLLFDAMEVAAAVAVFNARLQGEEDTFAWRLVVNFTLLGVIANALHALTGFLEGRIVGWQMLLAIGLTSLFPISVALAVHLLKGVVGRHLARTGRAQRLDSLARREGDLRRRVDGLTQREGELVEVVHRLEGEVPPTDPSTEKERLQGVFLSYVQDNPEATYDEVGDKVGRSPHTVKDWASELREQGALTKNGRGWEVTR